MKSVLDDIAREYLERRPNGYCMDQIQESLFEHYSISEPVEFSIGFYNPIPFGNLTFAGVAKQLPQDALRLGEIAYLILCHRGIYPKPQQAQGPRDSACEYDALSNMCSACQRQMAVLESSGKRCNPDLRQMIKDWSALDSEIEDQNTAWETAFEKACSEPERPEMWDKGMGTKANEGLFGTKWTMTIDEAMEVLPPPEEPTSSALSHFGKYRGHKATFSYSFETHGLAEIRVCLNDSSEKQYQQVQVWLAEDFGPMPDAEPLKHFQLFSRAEVGKIEIKHWLRDFDPVGTTEMIEFRKMS